MTAALSKQNEPIVITQYEVLLDDIDQAKKNYIPSFEYETKDGDKAARSYVFQLRKLKGKIESQRKEAKAYALSYGKAVDQQAKTLVDEVEALIAPHQTALDAIAQREARRVEALQFRLERAEALGQAAFGATSTEIQAQLNLLDAESVEGLQEFEDRVLAAITRSRLQLKTLLEKAQQVEAEAQELQRLRAEQQERERREREERQARELQERADAEAQAAAADAIAQAERRAAEAEAKATAAVQALRLAQKEDIKAAIVTAPAVLETPVLISTRQRLINELKQAIQGMDRVDVCEAIADDRLHHAVRVLWHGIG